MRSWLATYLNLAGAFTSLYLAVRGGPWGPGAYPDLQRPLFLLSMTAFLAAATIGSTTGKRR